MNYSFDSSRTDMALEINDSVDKNDTKYKGIKISESIDLSTQIRITNLEILNAQGEELFSKDKGTYITIEADRLDEKEPEYIEKLTDIITDNLLELIKPYLTDNKNIFVIGLGNREITADALGPKVIDKLLVNRHIISNHYENIRLSCMMPGVMAKTGIESSQIIKGVSNIIKPGVIIVIDSLAARSVNHLNKSIQMSNSGIMPGSGVGNHREGIYEKNIGIPVIAVGIPTVIEMNNMMVTPKDVDITIKNLSDLMANSINNLVYGYEL